MWSWYNSATAEHEHVAKRNVNGLCALMCCLRAQAVGNQNCASTAEKFTELQNASKLSSVLSRKANMTFKGS